MQYSYITLCYYIYRFFFHAAGMKYDVSVTRNAPQAFRLQLGGSFVDVVGRKLNDGGLLIQVDAVSSTVATPEAYSLSDGAVARKLSKKCREQGTKPF